MKGRIYKTTCLVNGKVYIGQTIRIDCKHYLGGGMALKAAIKKHGRHNFIKEVLITCYSQEILDEYESLFIELFSSTDPEIGYNILPGTANGFGGVNPSTIPEIADKIRKALTGRKKSEECCMKMRGIKHREDAKTRIKGKNKGKTHTEEEKDKFYGFKYIPIEAYNPITGIAIDGMSFKKIKDAAKFIGISNQSMRKGVAMSHKSGGYYWRYSELENKRIINGKVL
jgi:group I intron endonuclease